MHQKSFICFSWLFLFYLASLVGCLVSIHFFNDFVGLITGSCIMIATLPFYIVLRKKKYIPAIISLINGFGTGASVGTFYVMQEVEFSIMYAVIGIAACLALYFAYTILIRNEYIKKHAKFFTIVSSIMVLCAFIKGWIETNPQLFSHMTFMFIASAFYVFALIRPALDSTQLFKHIAMCSYGALFLVSIIVLIIISEGNGLSLDFLGDFSFDTSDIKNKKMKNNLRRKL